MFKKNKKKVVTEMNTIVLKFGGSSVADNIKLNVVAEKIISLKKEAKNIVVVVSAQGKTTDRLIKKHKNYLQYQTKEKWICCYQQVNK